MTKRLCLLCTMFAACSSTSTGPGAKSTDAAADTNRSQSDADIADPCNGLCGLGTTCVEGTCVGNTGPEPQAAPEPDGKESGPEPQPSVEPRAEASGQEPGPEIGPEPQQGPESQEGPEPAPEPGPDSGVTIPDAAPICGTLGQLCCRMHDDGGAIIAGGRCDDGSVCTAVSKSCGTGVICISSYCLAPTDSGATPDGEGAIPDAGPTCGLLGQACCANHVCSVGLTCSGQNCVVPDGGAAQPDSDLAPSDGGVSLPRIRGHLV